MSLLLDLPGGGDVGGRTIGAADDAVQHLGVGVPHVGVVEGVWWWWFGGDLVKYPS